MTERTADVLYPAQLVARRRAVRRARSVRIRRIVVAVLTTASLLYGGWALAHSRLFALDGVEVAGAHHVSRDELMATGRIRLGMNMLSIDPGAIARRLETIPIVATAHVDRLYPSKLRVVISERVPAAALGIGDSVWLLDARGIAIAAVDSAPRGLPVVRFGKPTPVVVGQPVDTAVRAGLTVWEAVPTLLRPRVSSVDVTDDADIILWLGSVRVELGDQTLLPDKFGALGALISESRGRILTSVNLTAPTRPAARYA